MKKGLSWCRGQQWALISIAAFIALGSGCTGKQKSGQDELRAKLAAQYQWPQDKTKEAAFETWAGGDEEGAVQVSNQSNVQESSVEALFFHAEVLLNYQEPPPAGFRTGRYINQPDKGDVKDEHKPRPRWSQEMSQGSLGALQGAQHSAAPWKAPRKQDIRVLL